MNLQRTNELERGVAPVSSIKGTQFLDELAPTTGGDIKPSLKAAEAVKTPETGSEASSKAFSLNLSEFYVIKKTRLIRVKTKEEIDFLEQQFVKDPDWTRKTVQFCKKNLNLETAQIYKWGFDKKMILKKNSSGRRIHKKSQRLANNSINVSHLYNF